MPVKGRRRQLFSSFERGLSTPPPDREGTLAHRSVPCDQIVHGLCPTGRWRTIPLLPNEFGPHQRARICLGELEKQPGAVGVQSVEELLPVFQGGAPVRRKVGRFQRITEGGGAVCPVHLREPSANLPVQAMILLALAVT